MRTLCSVVALCCLLLSACGEDQQSTPLLPELPPCLTDRATVQTFDNAAGTVINQEGELLIQLSDNNLLAPCNLPDAFQGNEQITFSGNQKETLPNERWPGQPIELTGISELSGQGL